MENFLPAGNTLVISGSTTTPSATKAVTAPGSGSVDYRIYNQGNNDAWLGMGPTSAIAVSNSVVPAISADTPAQTLPVGQILTLTGPPQSFFAARTQLGSTNLYISPGHRTSPNF